MKNSLRNQALFTLLTLSSLTSALADQEVIFDCGKALRTLKLAGVKAAKENQKQERRQKPWHYLGVREKTSRGVQKLFTRDPYLYADSTERTWLPKALFWARSAFGRVELSEVDVTAVKLIQSDLEASVIRVFSYPADMLRLGDDLQNLKSELAATELAWKGRDENKKPYLERGIPNEGIQILFPYYVDGKMVMDGDKPKLRTRYYGPEVAFRVKSVVELRKTLKEKSLERRKRGRQQVVDTQKLTIFAHTLRDEASVKPDTSPEENLAAVSGGELGIDFVKFLTSVDTIYCTSGNESVMKTELIPPYTEWNSWHWAAFRHQLKSVWFKSKGLVSKEQQKNAQNSLTVDSLINFLKSLTVAEIRGNGLANLQQATKQGFIGMAKNMLTSMQWGWLRTPLGVALAVAGGGGLWTAGSSLEEESENEQGLNPIQAVYRRMVARVKLYEKCVKTIDDKEYAKCIVAYLSERYTEEYVKNVVYWNDYADGSVVIGDEELAKVKDELDYDREEFLDTLRKQKVLEAQLTRLVNNAGIAGSSASAKVLMLKSEDEMRRGLLSRNAGKAGGYFASNIETAPAFSNPRLAATVDYAVENRLENPLAWRVALQRLKDSGEGQPLADALEEFFSEREKSVYEAYAQEDELILHEAKVAAVLEMDKFVEEKLKSLGLDDDAR